MAKMPLDIMLLKLWQKFENRQDGLIREQAKLPHHNYGKKLRTARTILWQKCHK